MAFIDKTDLTDHIRQNKLDDVTNYDDTKLPIAIAEMEALMKGYLSARNYDIDALFNATGGSRDPVIKMYLCQMTVYRLHRLINWRKIPDFVIDGYNEAKQWCVDVQNCQINPPQWPVLATGEKNYIKFGGNEKRQY